jgi:hypothetical protein
MANLHGFDANQVPPPSRNYEPVPAGEYLAVIIDSEMRPNRAGTGSYLQLTFQLLKGEHKGRLLRARLNLDNPNPTAVAIAKAELAAICRAVGVLAPQDSTELHDLPLMIHVRCIRRLDNGEVVNEIKDYSPKATMQQQQQSANSTPQWRL